MWIQFERRQVSRRAISGFLCAKIELQIADRTVSPKRAGGSTDVFLWQCQCHRAVSATHKSPLLNPLELAEPLNRRPTSETFTHSPWIFQDSSKLLRDSLELWETQ